MFVIPDAGAAAIRTVFAEEGEMSAADSGDHRHREGAGLRPDHRRMDTAAGATPAASTSPTEATISV
jgi:hypothetical protein